MTDSLRLRAHYAANGSEEAFRQVVASYVDLVYSTAVRLVDGDRDRAQDAAQEVFVDLARLSGELSSQVMLGGWLHRHTCFVAAKTMRCERRRQNRERQAAEMNGLEDHEQARFDDGPGRFLARRASPMAGGLQTHGPRQRPRKPSFRPAILQGRPDCHCAGRRRVASMKEIALCNGLTPISDLTGGALKAVGEAPEKSKFQSVSKTLARIAGSLVFSRAR